ncbi:MAG: heparinase II/III family protein [Armatimonadetes bacterium]|nr:heparinase II/III family protein [Armatimonadota bacterium]
MDFARILCIAMLALAAAACAGTVEPLRKEHPYLFIERSDVPGIKDRARRFDWAAGTLDALKTRADGWLRRKIEVPPSTGRHSVSYVCSECMEPLETLSPTEHRCPKCRKVYSGLPYDAHLYNGRHDELAAAARDLGLAALFFDNKAYASRSLRILLGYADTYDSYPLLDNRGGQAVSAARVFDQTLNEAIWLIDIAWAYDLVLGAGVGSPAERAKVEGLLRKSAETVQRYNPLKSNWQSWHNAGLICVALCLRDEKLLDKVLNGDGGFYYQMEHSVLSDGAWYEGSWSYHAYTMSALLRTSEAAVRSGIDLYKSPQLKKMLEAPLRCLMPNGRAPATNDGMEQGASAGHYEVAAARYGGPMFEDVVARGKRAGYDALFIGLENPKRRPSALGSDVMEGIGLALLRRGDQFVSLDFGPHGGGHGHLDKLAVNYFTLGRTVAPDLGRGWPYNLPIHVQWYKKTLSHNTVTVDEMPQKECEGKLESRDFEGDCHTATASADAAYDGVSLRRTVALGDTWLLDIYEALSDAEHTYDWVWHGRGDFSTALPNAPAEMEFTQPSYSYLSNIRQGDGSNDWRAAWKPEGGTVYGLFRGASGRDVILCDAPDNPRTNTLHSVILRDRAKRSVFVSLFSTRPMDWQDLPAELRRNL